MLDVSTGADAGRDHRLARWGGSRGAPGLGEFAVKSCRSGVMVAAWWSVRRQLFSGVVVSRQVVIWRGGVLVRLLIVLDVWN